ncbi:MAG: Rossmann-like and DUF2520 domain-containing protein [Pyrinomonadaceae bacterium]
MTDICIIGVGNIGGSLAIALTRAGYNLSQLVTCERNVSPKIKRQVSADSQIVQWKDLKAIDSKVIFITTPDPEIEKVSERISQFVKKGQFVFHASGSLSSAVLQTVADNGCLIASLHPLTSVSDPIRGALQFEGTYFCIEGEAKAVKLGKRIVKDLGGHSFAIATESKPLYHAAAVTAAGHVTALFDVAVEMLSKCGLSMEESQRIFFPLIRSTVQNLEHERPVRALTGSFARLDVDAFERHLEAMRCRVSPEIINIYLSLGQHSLALVERRDGITERSKAFGERLSMARRKSR